MTDNLTKDQRRAAMANVKSKDTGPEMKVRKLIHGMGYRYRLHRKDLPGKPDLVFPGLKKVIFVHGCFWHGHKGCAASQRPTSNTEYWNAKLDRNLKRDQKNLKALEELGWRPLVIWECQTRDETKMRRAIVRFLGKRHGG
jgi:DNA mismatch endonuclease (patch repair protein)